MWVVCSSSPCDLPHHHHHHPLQCPRHPRGVWPRPVNKNIRCTNPFSSPLPPSQPHRDPLQRPPLNIDLNPHTERQSSRSSGWGRHEGDTNKWWPVLCQINPRPVCLILWVSPSLSVHTSEVGLGQIVLVAFISQPNHTRHQLSPPVVPTIPLPQSTYY